MLTRDNPELRIELDEYFPPYWSQKNTGANLEQETLVQAQLQFIEWQRTQLPLRQHGPPRPPLMYITYYPHSPIPSPPYLPGTPPPLALSPSPYPIPPTPPATSSHFPTPLASMLMHAAHNQSLSHSQKEPSEPPSSSSSGASYLPTLNPPIPSCGQFLPPPRYYSPFPYVLHGRPPLFPQPPVYYPSSSSTAFNPYASALRQTQGDSFYASRDDRYVLLQGERASAAPPPPPPPAAAAASQGEEDEGDGQPRHKQMKTRHNQSPHIMPSRIKGGGGVGASDPLGPEATSIIMTINESPQIALPSPLLPASSVAAATAFPAPLYKGSGHPRVESSLVWPRMSSQILSTVPVQEFPPPSLTTPTPPLPLLPHKTTPSGHPSQTRPSRL
jgi:hypothetical protein